MFVCFIYCYQVHCIYFDGTFGRRLAGNRQELADVPAFGVLSA